MVRYYKIWKSTFYRMLLVFILLTCPQLTHATVGEQTQMLTGATNEPNGLEERYPVFHERATEGNTIPLLEEGYVPQGLSMLESGLHLITFYKDKSPSVMAMETEDGTYNVYTLKMPDGSFHKGHVGGISIWGNWIFIASGGYVLCIDRHQNDFSQNVSKGEINVFRTIKFSHKTSALTVHNSRVYIAEFEKHQKNKPQLFVYECERLISPRANVKKLKPLQVFSIPEKIQGLTFVNASQLYLSASYGPSSSTLYEATLEGSRLRIQNDISMPAGAEGIVLNPDTGTISILFESAATKYKKRWVARGAYITDSIWHYKLPQ